MPVAQPTQGGVSGAFSRLGEQAVDGIIILIEVHQLDESDVDLPDGVPVVVVVDSGARYDYPVVDTDQAQGARLATEHLLALGHKTVWHIAGPPWSYAAERRQRSWRETLERHGRVAPTVLIGDWTSGSGYRLGTTLSKELNATAVFVANDQMALGLLRALHEAGRQVPKEISVVGFDDIGEAADYWPPLTTVRQSFAEVGRRSVDALVGEIRSGTHRHKPVHVSTELIIRNSTSTRR
jgi:DNA-binding LacI/PurR family transcriptional regulator